MASTKTPSTNTEYYNKRILTVEEASWYTGLARGTLRNMTCNRMIPHYKPSGKLIYFLKSDLDNWMLQNRIPTEAEIEQQALQHVTSKRR